MLRFEESSRREWLETNGLGGYASSTTSGLNTRRYHGLLVSAGRVLLSKVEETLAVGARRYELSTNRYPGTLHPQGFAWLAEFRLDPYPVWVFECEGTRIEKSLFMVHGEDTTVILYKASEACVLEVRPLIAFRDYHSLTHENNALRTEVQISPDSVSVAPYDGMPTLHLLHAGGYVDPHGFWYRKFEYDRERERGLDFQEDLFQPFTLNLNLTANAPAAVIASTQARAVKSADALRKTEIARRHRVGPSTLARAADQFLVENDGRSTIIAGYHWFGDWGRDTMISLPGLTLATGRPDTARSILLSFAGVANCGLLPNRFPGGGAPPDYNSADATLWYFEAIRAYTARTGDFDLVRERLYDVLADMIAWHERGTHHGIHMDEDGLLYAGEARTQLTWMDAKVGDLVVTPRRGKPVEIEALWYSALRTMEDFAGLFGHEAQRAQYGGMAARVKTAFLDQFWNMKAECLFDVVDGETADAAIRPNQIFAVSLLHGMLPRERAASVVSTVQRHLSTPFGLRTLAPSDPQYRGRYEGDPRSRDTAYHQGTVWPWLMGPFIEAYLWVNEGSAEARRQAAEWIAPLLEHLDGEGTGQLPEVFDGDAPHRAGGAIAQAWSVAEMLRIREMLTYRQ